MSDYTPREKWFEVVLEAAYCQRAIESAMEERWRDQFCEIGCDPYDGSIEIYFGPDCAPDWMPSAEDMGFLNGMGITFGWMNFCNGQDLQFHHNSAYPRQPKAHSWWTVIGWFNKWNGTSFDQEQLRLQPAYLKACEKQGVTP